MHNHYKFWPKTGSNVVCSTTARSSHYLARSRELLVKLLTCSRHFARPSQHRSTGRARHCSIERLVEPLTFCFFSCCFDRATLINRSKLQTIHIRHIFIDPLYSTRQSMFYYMFKVNVIIKIIGTCFNKYYLVKVLVERANIKPSAMLCTLYLLVAIFKQLDHFTPAIIPKLQL